MNETLKAMKTALGTTIQRCHNSNNAQYELYGGRGIKVCLRWRNSFEAFVEDMGVRPEGLTLERKNNDLGYNKKNCVWATRLAQSNNRRANKMISWQGREMPVAAWERELGLKQGTLKARLGLLGYTVEEAFTKPVKCGAKLAGRVYKERKKPDFSGIGRGTANHGSKFTDEDITRYRARWKAGETFSALAREHGVSVTPMSNACQALGPYKGT